MRGLLAVLSGLVAVVALAVALPAAWVDRNVAEQEGYVDLSRSLLEDDAIRARLVSSVSAELEARARDLAERSGVPSSLVPDVRAEVEAAADELLASDAAVDAWAESQRQSWQAMFDGSAPGFVVALGPVAGVLADAVALPVGDVDATVTVDDPTVRSAVQRAEQADTAWRIAGVVAALAALVALVAARRRSVALAWLGAGAVVAAGAVWLAANVVERSAAWQGATGQGDDLAATVAGAVIDAATASLDDWLAITAVAGGVVAVVGVLAAVATRGRV